MIPKSTNATSLSDYMTISSCNLLYKFISKVLSNRLKMAVGKLVSDQCAFLAGRYITDCNLLAHELVRDFKKIGARAYIKVDLRRPLTV